jgi:hypothetical protein
MQQVVLITDYQGRFGTKYGAVPYRSGMDREIIAAEFRKAGFEPLFCRASHVQDLLPGVSGTIFLFTSSEDRGGAYKSYLEDLVLALTEMGATVIPRFPFLRAHNNKVFMELLRKRWGPATGDSLTSRCYGSYGEMTEDIGTYTWPVVVKRPDGFRSRGVWLASSAAELKRIARRISSTPHLLHDIKDYLRRFRHPNFMPASTHRGKFLVQQFIPGLANDWKVLVYGNRYYVLRRLNRKNDFRASGSGRLSYDEDPPAGLLDFAAGAFAWFNVPNISVDMAYDGTSWHLLELQFLYFGTYTIENAPHFFTPLPGGGWKRVREGSLLEREYVMSIIDYLRRNGLTT